MNGADLLRTFARNGPRIVFFAKRRAITDRGLTLLDHRVLNSDTTKTTFPSVRITLRSIFRRTGARQVILVVSRCPCLTRDSPNVSSYLRALVSRRGSADGLFLMLYKSSVDFVRRRMLKRRDPLCKHHAVRLHVSPFAVFSTTLVLPSTPVREIVRLCSIINKVPLCLSRLSNAHSAR